MKNFKNEQENNLKISECIYNKRLSEIEKEHLMTLSIQTPYTYYDLANYYIRLNKCLITFEKIIEVSIKTGRFHII